MRIYRGYLLFFLCFREKIAIIEIEFFIISYYLYIVVIGRQFLPDTVNVRL